MLPDAQCRLDFIFLISNDDRIPNDDSGEGAPGVDLFHILSPQSIYYRFFSPLKSMTHDMLVQLTQIDYDLNIALVAIYRSQKEEKMRSKIVWKLD